jgi:hypothetical protein
MANVVRFRNMEFAGAEQQPVFVNPELVAAAGLNEHGVTYLQTFAGKILVKETPEEALELLGFEVPVDVAPIDVPAKVFAFGPDGRLSLGQKEITEMEVTSVDKKQVFAIGRDYDIDPHAGVVFLVAPPAPPEGTLPVEPELKPWGKVLISFSYLPPPPPPKVEKETLLTRKGPAEVEEKE